MLKKSQKKSIFIFFCLLPLLIITLNIYTPCLFAGLDWIAHTSRMVSLHNEIKYGQFLPLFDYWNNNHGYSWQAFYPPLTNIYFLLSFIFCYGTSNIVHLKFIWLLINLINFLCAFYAAYRQYKSYWAGLFCSALLLSTAFYLTTIFIRFAVAELASYGFIMLFIRGLDSLRTDQKDRFLIPLMASLICLTDIPITICVATMSFVYFLFYFNVLMRKENIIFLLKSLIITILISSIYLLPLLYQLHGNYIVMSSETYTYDLMYSLAAKLPLVLLNINPYQNMLFSIGVIGNIVTIILFFTPTICSKKNIFFIIVIIYLTTYLFPWWIFPNKFIFFNIMQYPWRLFSIAICVMSLWFSPIALTKRKFIYCPIIIILSLLCNSYPIIKAYTHRHTVMNNYNNTYIYPDYLNINAMNNGNFQRFDVSKHTFPTTSINANYSINSSKIIYGFPQYNITVKNDDIILLPIIYYNFIKIYSNNKSLQTIYTKDGRLGVYLPKGNYILSVSEERIQYYIGFILFILGFILLVHLKKSDNKILNKE